MKYAVIYSNSTGNTKLLADKVHEFLSETKDECVYFGEVSEEALKAERIYLGFWTNKGVCDEVASSFLEKIKTQELFLFGSAGFGMSEDYFTEIINKSLSFINDGVKVIGHFMCQGKMPMSVKERYLQMKKENKAIPNLDMLIENFDMALSHPDNNDFNNLKKAILK